MKTEHWILLGIVAYVWYTHASQPPAASDTTTGLAPKPPVPFTGGGYDPGITDISCGDPTADPVFCQMIEDSRSTSPHVG